MYNELRGMIVSKYGSLSNYADANGLHVQRLYNLINGKISMNVKDVELFVNNLHIDVQDIPKIFFLH